MLEIGGCCRALAVVAAVVYAVAYRTPATRRAAFLALGFLFAPPIFNTIEPVSNTNKSLVLAAIGQLSFISTAEGQSALLAKSQRDALNAYQNAVNHF